MTIWNLINKTAIQQPVLTHVPSYLFGEPVFYSILIVKLAEQRSETCYTWRDKSGPAPFLQHPELYLLTLSHLLCNEWLVFQNLLILTDCRLIQLILLRHSLKKLTWKTLIRFPLNIIATYITQKCPGHIIPNPESSEVLNANWIANINDT